MNYKSKYIIVDNKDGIIPVVFTELATHKDVARGFMPGSVLGAGFASLTATVDTSATAKALASISNHVAQTILAFSTNFSEWTPNEPVYWKRLQRH
jgi:hypothetical protein